MRVAFYAPLKAPDHPVPSGDRQMARMLMAALAAGGHQVELAAAFRSYDGAGDAGAQRSLQQEGEAEARRLIAAWTAAPERRPAAWLSYHVYHKSPDVVGPAVARHFRLPYLIAEASIAAKQAAGRWALGYGLALAAIRQADALLCLTRQDMAGLAAAIDGPGRLRYLPPFLDAAPLRQAAANRPALRRRIAAAHGLATAKPWLLAVGMMRPGDKAESYRRLAQALALIPAERWQLVVVGDGAARGDIEAALAATAGTIRYTGALPPGEVVAYYAASDIYVWPAANEAYGMALLEAQAAGLPVVAGAVRGVPDIVEDGVSGLLTADDDPAAFAAALAGLLADPAARRRLGGNARRIVADRHDLGSAAIALTAVIERLAPAVNTAA